MRQELEQIKISFEKQPKHKPKSCKKYRCFNGHTIGRIRNDYLWLSKPSKLNDSFKLFFNDSFNPNKLIVFVGVYKSFMMPFNHDVKLTRKKR